MRFLISLMAACFLIVHRYPNDLTSRFFQTEYLSNGRLHICCFGGAHALNNDFVLSPMVRFPTLTGRVSCLKNMVRSLPYNAKAPLQQNPTGYNWKWRISVDLFHV